MCFSLNISLLNNSQVLTFSFKSYLFYIWKHRVQLQWLDLVLRRLTIYLSKRLIMLQEYMQSSHINFSSFTQLLNQINRFILLVAIDKLVELLECELARSKSLRINIAKLFVNCIKYQLTVVVVLFVVFLRPLVKRLLICL